MSQNYNTFALADVVLDMHQGINTAANKVVYADNGCSIIQSKNFTSGSLDLNDVKYLNSDDVVKYGDKYTPKIGDILFSNIGTVGKSIVVETNSKFMFAWNVFRIQLNKDLVDAYYLKYYLDYLLSIGFYESLFTGGTVKFINKKKFGGIQIPLPPLPVQKQIAAVLEKADTLRGQCQKMEQELNILAQSVFLDMFGDPVTNPKGWKTEKLNNLVSICSGATPSKSNELFWKGKFPWVSPKDMKYNYIIDSIDHVSEIVFEETNLKRIDDNTILIVVRGMILVHTVPIAITKANVSINQDIKALKVVRDEVEPVYLLWCLKSQHDHILSKVSTAAHGTKRLDMPDLIGLNVTIPRKEMQQKFCRLIETLDEQLRFSKAAVKSHDGLFNSLMQRAFKGELTLKDIA